MTISKAEIALLDTNVLVYGADESSPFHKDPKNIRDNALLGFWAMLRFAFVHKF